MSKYPNLIKYGGEIYNFEKLAKASGSNPSAFPPKFVNVDDFGAKGDGTDDSEVQFLINFIKLRFVFISKIK